MNEDKWTPDLGQSYWYVSPGGHISKTDFDGGNFDNSLVATGNCFKTEEEAIKFKRERY